MKKNDLTAKAIEEKLSDLQDQSNNEKKDSKSSKKESNKKKK